MFSKIKNDFFRMNHIFLRRNLAIKHHFCTKNPSLTMKVCFVLGGPGSGKGTVCQRLRNELGAVHLSAGELLRQEMDETLTPDSPYQELIAEAIAEGRIVPGHITVALLHQAIATASNDDVDNGAAPFFLIDGFPRSLDNLRCWRAESTSRLSMASTALFLDCPDDELRRRLLARGLSSGRTDDNDDSIRKRLRTHHHDTPGILEELAKSMPVARVRADQPADQVFLEAKAHLVGS